MCGPGRKCGTPVSGWQQQLVSRIEVPGHAPQLPLPRSKLLNHRLKPLTAAALQVQPQAGLAPLQARAGDGRQGAGRCPPQPNAGESALSPAGAALAQLWRRRSISAPSVCCWHRRVCLPACPEVSLPRRHSQPPALRKECKPAKGGVLTPAGEIRSGARVDVLEVKGKRMLVESAAGLAGTVPFRLALAPSDGRFEPVASNAEERCTA